MGATLLNFVIFGIMAFFIFFIVYGLLGYAKEVFRANRR